MRAVQEKRSNERLPFRVYTLQCCLEIFYDNISRLRDNFIFPLSPHSGKQVENGIKKHVNTYVVYGCSIRVYTVHYLRVCV